MVVIGAPACLLSATQEKTAQTRLQPDAPSGEVALTEHEHGRLHVMCQHLC